MPGFFAAGVGQFEAGSFAPRLARRIIERRGWWAIVVSDVLEDIRSMLLANADDIPSAMTAFEEELELKKTAYKRLLSGFKGGDGISFVSDLHPALEKRFLDVPPLAAPARAEPTPAADW